jgi:hypothetical protein
MTTSRADTHDLDKLSRWYDGLVSGDAGSFPVYAIFLVSPEDREAHDIFRRFRSSFEARAAPFHNLVIFGQHGVSSTVLSLLPCLGLGAGHLPLLALLDGLSSDKVYSLGLKGSAWQGVLDDVLDKVEVAADGSEGRLDLDTVPGLTGYSLGDKSLVETVSAVLKAIML